VSVSTPGLEIVTAAVGAKFRVDALTEWLNETFDPRGDPHAEDVGGSASTQAVIRCR
jgi:hypothetical protein